MEDVGMELVMDILKKNEKVKFSDKVFEDKTEMMKYFMGELGLDYNKYFDFLTLSGEKLDDLEGMPNIGMDSLDVDFYHSYILNSLENKLLFACQDDGIFARVTENYIRPLSKFLDGKKVIELMCGKGLISKRLKAHGVDIRATDNNNWGISDNPDIEIKDALEVVKDNLDVDYFILAWSPLNDTIDLEILNQIRENNKNQKLIVIGESYGCTGSEEFFDEAIEVTPEDKNFLLAQQNYESLGNIRDSLEMYH